MKRRGPRSTIKLNPVPVQNYLDRSNLSQKDMACLVEISEAYFSQLMNGDRSPSAKLRGRFLHVMGVTDFDQLFFMEDSDD